ncbi:MAG TPA: hypothetical protein VER35_01300, partial [Candidatus Limnocylindrales bacterium]|nr:hypothetical protein [Candidatus Limnocylindrales bacterium]
MKKPDSNHGNSSLTSEQELRIVGYLRAFDLAGQGLTSLQTQTLVSEIHPNLGKKWNSGKWIIKFTAKYYYYYYYYYY